MTAVYTCLKLMCKKFFFLCLITTSLIFQWGCNTRDKSAISIDYPKIERILLEGNYFGQVVRDEFSNLHNLKEPTVRTWFSAQDSLTESFFKQNKLYQDYVRQFTALDDNESLVLDFLSISESGRFFYTKEDSLTNISHIYYRDGYTSNEDQILSETDFPYQDQNISYLKPSYDGSKLAIGFKKEGDFASTVRIFDVTQKKLLDDVISQINPSFGGVEWLPDGDSFIYLYFPVVNQELPGYKKNSYSILHQIGEPSNMGTAIFGKSSGLDIIPDFYPKVKIGSQKDKYVIGYVARSDSFYDAYIANVSDVNKGQPNWKLLYTSADKIYNNMGELQGDNFYFLQSVNSGNRLCSTKLGQPNFQNPEVIAESISNDIVEKFDIAGSNIYYSRVLNGVSTSLFRIDAQGQTLKLKLPFAAGSAYFEYRSVYENDFWVTLDGWTSEPRRYRITSEGELLLENFGREMEYPQFKNLISEQITVKSHDGVEVPLSLIYDKNLAKDGSHEVFINVYGAYGDSMSPFFFPIFLEWAAQGGILAFPHVRGGGEKGEAWHLDGMKSKKYNSWKDLIACTEALIALKFTSQGKISLYTSSAGGIAAGMAINERPDLYSSFIAEVPRLHPFGLETATTASSTSYLEYGTVKDSTECVGLMAMDPYINLDKTNTYPATLLFLSYNDDRIPLWDGGKYIAKLQTGKNKNIPYLMDIDYNSGHEDYSAYDAYISLYAKMFSFAKSNMK